MSHVLLSFDFVDHVDKFVKQTTPLAPPTIDDSSSSYQPQMSATEKKQLLIQYGCTPDDEDEHEANIETSNKGMVNKMQLKAIYHQQAQKRHNPPLYLGHFYVLLNLYYIEDIIPSMY